MATPAAISKLTDLARTAKEELADAEVMVPIAERVITDFVSAKTKFKANMGVVSSRTDELNAAMAELGNAAAAMDDAFRDDAKKPDAGATQVKFNGEILSATPIKQVS